jgi:acyl-CoA synthetase (AMP-forming)/AMP-acid ligase II
MVVGNGEDQGYAGLGDVLRARALDRPEQTACVFIDRHGNEAASATYAGIDRDARALAVTLGERVSPGDRVLIMCPPGIDFVTGFFACQYAGLIAVPVSCPDAHNDGKGTRDRLAGIVKDCTPAVALTTAEVAENLRAGDLGGTDVLLTSDSVPELADLWAAREEDLTAPALLQYTSGTIGTAKGVVLSHAAILANLAGMSKVVIDDVQDVDEYRCVSWLPVFHSMGLSVVLTSFLIGGRLALLAPETFLANPVTWLTTVTRERAQWIGAPNFGYEICAQKITADQRAALDLSSVCYAAIGAEAIRWPAMERFSDAFAEAGFQASAFLPCYGLSEAMGFVGGARVPGERPYIDLSVAELEAESRVVTAGAASSGRRVVGCGQMVNGMEAVIVGRDGTVRASGEVGEIWLRGGAVAQGYWHRPQATAERFGATLANGEGSYLRTGDVGFLAGGQLFVLGRLDDLIIVDGRNHYPYDIEATAASAHAALADGKAAAFAYDANGRTQLGVVVETRAGAAAVGRPTADGGIAEADVVSSIRRAIAEEHQLRAAAVLLLKPGCLPVTASGKVQRRRSKEMFLAGEHDTW